MIRALKLIPFLFLGLACADGSRLDPGVPVTRSIAVDQPHLHPISLQAGDFLELSLDQDGENLALVLQDPEGRRIVALDTPNGPFGRELLYAVADVSGEYRVGVEVRGYVGGAYTLEAEVRRATEEDRRRALACRLLFEGWLERETGPEVQAGVEQAVALWEDLGDSYFAAVALLRLGRMRVRQGDKDGAEKTFRRARDHLGGRETRDLEPEVLKDLGMSLDRQGATKEARETLELALESAKAQGHLWTEATIRNDLGYVLYRHRTDLWLALGLYDRALEIFATLRDSIEEATTRHNRGLLLNWLGLEQEALEEYRKALELQNPADGHARAKTLLEIGWSQMWLGHDDEAERHLREAASLLKESGGAEYAAGLDRLGRFFLHQGRWLDARKAFLDALKALGSRGDPLDRARTLDNLGRAHLELGELPQAFGVLEEALSRTQNPSSRAHTLANRARAWWRKGERKRAVEDLEAALREHDVLRNDTRSPDFRARYFETVYEHFQLLVDYAMELEAQEPGQGWAGRAFEVVERSRARSLLELVTRLGSQHQREIGQSGLFAERSALEAEIRTLETDKRRLEASGAPLDEIDEVSRRLRERTVDLRYLEGVEPTPLANPRTLDEIRKALDPETSLLVYSLGEDHSYVWLLGTEGVIAWERLKSRVEIAERIRPLVRSLRNPDQGGSDLGSLDEELAELGRELLPSVALFRRLVVIPDGALHFLPFGTLRVDDRYLTEDHEISRLPSASVLVALRENRPRRSAAPNTLALLADPVFEPTDSRLSAEASAVAQRSRQDKPSGFAFLARLPKSGEEADAITSLVARDCRWDPRGFDATLESVSDDRLTQSSLLHFATHALLEDQAPELSQIVFSQFDRRGQARQGSLYAFEIAGLELSADLVVLSACQTALGQEIRGEGMVGLPQSFFEAGADRVLVSLWDVDDSATAELMEYFYEGLLRRRLPPAAALRHAQNLLRSSKDFGAPYYWAPFTLIGDWRELPSTLLDSPCLNP